MRRINLRAGRATKIADDSFRYVMLASSLSVMAIVVLILHELVTRSQLSISKFGFKLFLGSDWDPVAGSSAHFLFFTARWFLRWLPLVLAVPLAVGVAVFITEICPKACGVSLHSRWSCWLPSQASFTGFGRFSFWLRCCATRYNRPWPNRWAGPGFSRVLHLALACWRPESFWQS